MEAYALMALGGLGMYAAQSQFPSIKDQPQQPLMMSERPMQTRHSRPSANTVYDSRYLQNARKEETQRASAMDLRSKKSPHTGVVSRNHRLLHRGDHKVSEGKEEEQQSARKIRSQLAGIDIPMEHFTHNNMTPFYRGDMKQNMDPFANSAIMENLTGQASSTSSIIASGKQEVEKAMPTERNVGNLYGTPAVPSEGWRDRMATPRARNNEFPVPKVTVGPGIGNGFVATPSDGYMNQRPYMMPRDTDVLRVANNPKTTFDGRVLAGQGPSARGMPGDVQKNRPETTAEMAIESMQPTTGAFLKTIQRPEILDRPTARQCTTREYTGSAGGGARKQERQRPAVADARSHTLSSFQTGPVAAANQGSGCRDDKGRASIQVYCNARDTTSANVHQGNLNSLVKMITAPLLDVVRVNRGSCPHIVEHPREDGHFKGPSRIRVYDPDDVARTTLREGLTEEGNDGNLKGPIRVRIQDPHNTLKTTLKEVTLQEADRVNLLGPKRTTVHDPDDVLRTTLKEVALQESGGANITTSVARSKVYVNDGVRVTLRETVSAEDDGGPLMKPVPNPNVWDPSDVARVTMKQMLADTPREVGNATLRSQQGGYSTAEVIPKQTLREGTSDSDYIGHGKLDRGTGYTTAPTDLRLAAKAQLSDTDYFGTAAEQGPSAPSIQGATRVNEGRELVLQEREPTNSGTKVASGVGNMGQGIVRSQGQSLAPLPNYIERATVRSPDDDVVKQYELITHERQVYEASLERRLNDEASANDVQRSGNPLSLSLHDTPSSP